MTASFHILSFQGALVQERKFLQSLLCRSLSKRRLILDKATSKQLRVLQKLLVLCVRGEIPVTKCLVNRLKKLRKLKFIEESFNKVTPDSNLKKNILSLVSLIHLFINTVLKKEDKKK